MITEFEKREIYNFLTKKFKFGEEYPLSTVGKELTISGRGCRRYGFPRMKNLMKELKEFIDLKDYEHEGHSNSNVVLHQWKEETAGLHESSHFWAATSAEMAESENEMGGGLLRLTHSSGAKTGKKESAEPILKKVSAITEVQSPYRKRYTHLTNAQTGQGLTSKEMAGNRQNETEEREFTELEKEKIYQILCGKFPKGEQLHMAKISKYLVERGFTPRIYGFSKMKNLLQEMHRYLQMEDVIIHGVPNVLITLNEKPQSGKMNVAEEKQEKLPMVVEQPEAGPWPDMQTLTASAQSDRAGSKVEFQRLVYLPPKILDFLRRKGVMDPDIILAREYQKSLDEKTVQVNGYSIIFPLGCVEGEELIAVLKRNERPYGRQWYLSYVGSARKEPEIEEDEREEDHPIPPGKSLEHFADMGYWPDFLRDLAEIALPEKWDSHTRRYGRYYILKKYIQYTFYRLLQEDKICISPDRQLAAFNTGLVNKYYDDIYACFVPNPEEGGEEWKFEAFAIAGIRGKDGYGKLLTSYFNPLPPLPSYVQSSEDLIYDLSKELLTDYEHIIIDNLRRLPLGYLRECCYGDSYALDLISELASRWRSPDERRELYGKLTQYIEENDKIFRRLRSRLEDAIEVALKRVRWNYKTAIPCYFPKGNCLSLMLPLCLEDDDHTDAALVVQKNPSGSYQGQTLLRLDQAYLDARLICRPNIDWLQPDYGNDLLQKY